MPIGCSEPTQPEVSQPTAAAQPQFTSDDAMAGWQAALEEERAARMAADEALLAALGELTTLQLEEEAIVADQTSASILIQCPQGSLLTGGGANAFGGIGIADLLHFGPVTEFRDTWRAVMSNQSGNDLTLRAYEICLVLP
jgi:hypothetical protein